MTKVTIAALLLMMTACGDDGATVDGGTDSGMPDVGTDSNSDVSTSDTPDAGAVTLTVSATVVDGSDPDRPPIEGAHVVIRTDVAEYEEITGADGRYRIEFEAITGGNAHAVLAKEGYRILALLNPTGEPTDTFEEIALEQLMPAVPLARVVGTITGIPEGGRACLSAGRNTSCLTGNIDGMFPLSDIRDMTSALALNADETVYDFAIVPVVADGEGFTFSVDFDGVMETPPMTRTVTLELPADAESPLRKEPLDPRWVGFLSGFGPDFVRRAFTTGITTADGGATYTGTFSVFPEDGEEIGYTTALFVGGVYQPGASAGPNAQHFEWFGTTAPETVVIPEAPAIVAGTSLNDPLTVTAPPSEGTRYFGIFTSSGVQAWQVIDFAPSETLQVPNLPSAYDTSVSYPFAGSPGTARVSDELGQIAEDSRTPATFIRSAAHPITF